MGAIVIVNSHAPAHRTLEPPPPRPPTSSSSRRESLNDAADAAAPAPVEADDSNTNDSGEADAASAEAWTAALLPLVKGKTTLDEAKMAQTSDALREVEGAEQRGGIAREVLEVTASPLLTAAATAALSLCTNAD
jgi:hypothetical protein